MARITGKLAALYLGAGPTKVGDLFDWSFDGTNEILLASIKMDKFERFVPSHNTARITAQRYLVTSAVMLEEVFNAVDAGTQLAFRLDLIDANATFSQISGTGYFARETLTAPRGLVVENFEIQVDGEWAVTTPGAT